MNVCGYQSNNSYAPSFGAMKKSMFKGIDLAVVEKFKAPIEKFDTNADLQHWAESKFDLVCRHNYGSRTTSTSYQRQNAVDEWQSALNSGSYSPTERYLIMNGITKGLKPNDDTICMSHNKSVLDDTLTELKSKLEENPKEQFDFGKMYKSHLQQLYSAGDKIDENTTRWIVIPSKINDSEHFLDNVKRLQTLSHDNGCTKAKGADVYLKDCEFHIYFEKGKPKIALRFVDDEIREIQGVNNDRIIQPEYIEVMEKHLKDNDLYLGDRAERDFLASKELAMPKKVTSEPIQQEIKQSKQENQVFFGFINKLFS